MLSRMNRSASGFALTLLAPLVSLAAQGPSHSQPPETPPRDPVVRGLRVNEPAAFAGYTLFSPLLSGSTFLVDMQGEVVHRWEVGLPLGAMAYLLDDGHLLRTVRINENPRFFGGGLGGRLIELDWDGEIVWDFTLSDDRLVTHHGVERMPNGHVLVTAWEYVSRDEAITLGRDPEATGEEGFWPDAIFELEPTRPSGARIVWAWHARDHLVQDFDSTKQGYGSVPDHPERIDVNFDHRAERAMTPAQRAAMEEREREMRALGYAGGDAGEASAKEDGEKEMPKPDWMHSNAVDYSAELDLLVVSSPHLSEIFVIDHSTTTEQARGHAGGRYGRGGDLLYRWGNPRNYGAGEDSDRRLFYQHDVQWLRGTTGGAVRVLVFNNGGGRSDGDWSSVDEIELPFERERGFAREQGEAFGPDAPAWTYAAADKASFHSPFISGCQRLPNGSTFVCSGAQGRFFEVSPDGRVVWEFWNPHGGEIPASFGNAADRQPKVDPKAVFQALRIPPDHPALRGRDLARAK
jgi:hypothetical protein